MKAEREFESNLERHQGVKRCGFVLPLLPPHLLHGHGGAGCSIIGDGRGVVRSLSTSKERVRIVSTSVEDVRSVGEATSAHWVGSTISQRGG